MNGNMRVFLELAANAAGFKREMTESKSAVSRFVRGAKSELDSFRQMASSVHGQLAGLGLTIGAGKIMMDSARLDKSLTQIGQTAGEGGAKVDALRADLFRLARESGSGVEDLRDGFNSLVQSGLNMKEARETLEGVNVAMAVTGARAETLSSGLTVAATAFQFDLSKPGQALEMLDKMTVAGRKGNAELESLSSIFAGVGVNAASAGMGFEKTLAFIEGLSLVQKEPEKLRTLADSTLRVFTNLRYMSEAQGATGVKFFDAEGARRDALDVLTDIKAKYATLATDQERALFIQKAFGHTDQDTIKGIQGLLRGGSLDKVKEFSKEIGDAGGTLRRDFSEATRNLIDQAGMLKNDLREAADGFVKPINETLGHWIQFMRDKKESGGRGLDGKDMIVGGAVGLLGTMAAARYGGKLIGAGASRLLKHGGSVSVGVAEGKAVEAATGVQPVFVTNWPSSFGGGAGALADAATGAAAGGWLKNKAGALAKLALPFVASAGIPALVATGTGMVSYRAGQVMNAGMGWVSGQATGDKYGGSGWLGEMLYDVLHRTNGRDVKNDINLTIAIDGNGRVMTETSDKNTHTKINTMRRGSFTQTASAH